ncbi:hypothetical protein [uncultured Hyphomonas sp.]|uniref:hypothetical protein n=1 Tax=uncultured Hyphomonas sp. TaxID=225298 RepID=UPI0026067CAC|nr:hypothetical protein [uncultured Hyphomonas sp.]
MKLFLAASTAITLFALPAMAQSTTVEFASSDGTTALVVFYENGTASMDGGDPIPYTMDEESKTICGQTPEGDICATFDELGEDVGFSTGFTNTAGQSGTATITAAD